MDIVLSGAFVIAALTLAKPSKKDSEEFHKKHR